MTMVKTLTYALAGWSVGIFVAFGAASLLTSNGIHIGTIGWFSVGFVPTLLGMTAGFALGNR